MSNYPRLDETGLTRLVNKLAEKIKAKQDPNGDSQNNTATFTSSDVADGSATSWTSVSKLNSGETHSSIFAKVSQMFKNIRYLYKILGDTDISSLGSGTVTSALTTLNTSLGNKANTSDLATVATSGSYSDLLDQPTIPSYGVVSSSSNGLAPKVTNTSGYLKGDGTWSVPTNTTYTGLPDVYVSTAAATQAKVGTSPNYKLRSGARFTVRIANANTYSGVITLNINSTGAKNVYIDGTVSSSSNKTLPAGDYSVYYDGSYYYFNTADEITTLNFESTTLTSAVTNLNSALSNKQALIKTAICYKDVSQTNSAYTYSSGGLYRVEVGYISYFTNYPTGKTILAVIPCGGYNTSDYSFAAPLFLDPNKFISGWGIIGQINKTYRFYATVLYIN